MVLYGIVEVVEALYNVYGLLVLVGTLLLVFGWLGPWAIITAFLLFVAVVYYGYR